MKVSLGFKTTRRFDVCNAIWNLQQDINSKNNELFYYGD